MSEPNLAARFMLDKRIDGGRELGRFGAEAASSTKWTNVFFTLTAEP
jgi:hypothetical protein